MFTKFFWNLTIMQRSRKTMSLRCHLLLFYISATSDETSRISVVWLIDASIIVFIVIHTCNCLLAVKTAGVGGESSRTRGGKSREEARTPWKDEGWSVTTSLWRPTVWAAESQHCRELGWCHRGRYSPTFTIFSYHYVLFTDGVCDCLRLLVSR